MVLFLQKRVKSVGMWFTMLPVAALAAVVSGIPCEEARLKCAYREGCGTALQNYLVGCSAVLQGGVDHCPQVCEYSLIPLVSTEEGKALMDCECSDAFCEEEKRQTDICKANVLKTINEPIVPCRIAQRICNADAQCSMAFEYYERNCKAMFHGKKCTPKCHNSINILRRQDKAQKLKLCECDGRESYNCRAIQWNMSKLCFHHHNITAPKVQVHVDNTPQVIINSSSESVSIPSLLIFVTLVMIWTR